ncbi:MAG: TolC family protein [Candidatus Brocadiae bacterium]|nr:TolC family protein [Candidatus Brocadiia bacterium]
MCKVYLFFLVFLFTGCSTVWQKPEYEKIYSEYSPVFLRKGEKQSKMEKQMDITSSIRTALKGSPDLEAMSYRIEKARGFLVQAQAYLMPVVDLRWGYFHADSPATYFATKLEQHKFQLQGDLNKPGDFGSSQLGIRAGYSFNLAGTSLLQKKVADMGVAIAQNQKDAATNILVDAIILSFYDALAAKQFIQITEQSVQTVQSQLEETTVKYQGGSALKSDVLALKVRLAQANENVIKAKNRYQLALEALLYMMGVSPGQEIELMEQDWNPTSFPQNSQEGIVFALGNRPELKQARNSIIAARYGLDIAKGDYAPDLELFASYSFEDRDMKYSSNRDNWQMGLALSWRFFDGFLARGKEKSAKAFLQEMLAMDRKTTLMIEHEVSGSYRNYQEAQEREKVMSIAVEEAQENLSLVKKQFEGGSATITKYLDAELALTNSRFLLTSARYDIKKAKASVGKSLGLCGQCARELQGENQ